MELTFPFFPSIHCFFFLVFVFHRYHSYYYFVPEEKVKECFLIIIATIYGEKLPVALDI